MSFRIRYDRRVPGCPTLCHVKYTEEWIERGDHRVGLHRYPEPDGVDEHTALVVLLPAMGTPAGYYRPFAGALREAGLAVVVADLRGTGGSSPAATRACAYGYAELVDDVGAVLDAARAGGPRRTLILGHSLGGQLGLLHLALTGRRDVDGITLVASCLPYWRNYPTWTGWVVLPVTLTIHALTRVLGFWPGWAFGGRQSRGVVRDWAHSVRTGRFPALAGVDPMPALARLDVPVVYVSVDNDRLAPHELVDTSGELLSTASVRRERYTAAEAGGTVDHFRWTRASAPLARRIAAFTAEVTTLHR